MRFFAFSTRWTSLAAAAFSLLLCAFAQGADFKPLEDATKLERPTICSVGRDGIYFIDWDGQNRRLWMKGDFGRVMWSRDGKRVLFSADTEEFGWYTKYIMELETGRGDQPVRTPAQERIRKYRHFQRVVVSRREAADMQRGRYKQRG